MSWVKVALPYEGVKCNGCEWESDTSLVCTDDFCDLFDQFKGEGTRCVQCVDNGIR